MTKKLREMLEVIENKKAEAMELLNAGKVEEAKAMKDEILAMKEEYELANELMTNKSNENKGAVKNMENTKTNKTEFLNAVRNRSFDNALVSGTPASGGYVVPEDILTKIEQYRKQKDSLANHVRIEPVRTESGARTFKKRAQQTGFVTVAELEKFPEKATPQFERLEYAVEKYAGFFVASNEVLNDTDANLEGTLIEWIGDESRVTRNQLILTELNKKAKVQLADITAVKKATNVTLDPAFKSTTKYYTNQDGFNYLDTLVDDNGRFLLQETIAFASGYQLFGREVVVISNKDWASTTGANGGAPFVIGDLNEAVVIFDRQNLAIRSTDVGGDAFLTDSTNWRAIERLDVQTRDAEAFVFGVLPLA